MQELRFEEMKEYVLNRQNTVVQYIEMRPILDLCKETVRMQGTCVVKRWWDKEGLDLVGARAAVEAAEEEREGKDPWREESE